MKGKNFFWIGYSDLMTSLFFIILIVFFISYERFHKNDEILQMKEDNIAALKNRMNILKIENSKVVQLQNEVVVLEKEKEILETVQKNVEKLKNRKELFEYDLKYKRYTLKFDVQFKTDKYHIKSSEMVDFLNTKRKLLEVGKELKGIIDNLGDLQKTDKRYSNISYMIVVTGSASRIGDVDHNYELSYKRAYNLYKFWRKELEIDFDAKKYNDLVEFQIAGNGTGGVGRIEPKKGRFYTVRNQRFIINVIPKLGEM